MSPPADPPNAPHVADAAANNWVDRLAPAWVRPYLKLARFDRPIGVWLLLLPCWTGQALAAAEGYGHSEAIWRAGLFAIGAIVMRGAGCAYNDIVDRDFDAKVHRTAARPLPAGQITTRQAWGFTVFLSLVGLAVLLQFNAFTIGLGLASLALIAAYPFMKRLTWWPQIWLGLTFNWGALTGYAASAGELSTGAVALYASLGLWTLGYDTIYAHQDKEDDALIGVKSSARALGDRTKPALTMIYGGVIGGLVLVGVLAAASALYFAAIIAPALHFAWQIKKLDIGDSDVCLRIFKSNREAGFTILAALLLAGITFSA